MTQTNEREAKTWIQCFSGRKFWPLDPRPEDLSWGDIAHQLSLEARYSGATKTIYSVAEHSVGVSQRAAVLAGYRKDRKLSGWPLYCARFGLIHDASEAYLSDVARPVKRQAIMFGYREAERKLQAMICQWAGLGVVEPEEVRIADQEMLYTEARQIMTPLHPDWAPQLGKGIRGYKIACVSSIEAEKLFVNRARELGLL